MSKNRRRLDLFLDPSYSENLAGRSDEELHLKKAECVEVETEISYLRRLAQARIDIIQAETDRRASGGSIGDLIEALPRILADDTRPAPAQGHLPQVLAPDISIDWKRGLEHLVSDATLANLPLITDEELGEVHGQLRSFELEVSDARQSLHKVIDAIEREVAERMVTAVTDSD